MTQPPPKPAASLGAALVKRRAAAPVVAPEGLATPASVVAPAGAAMPAPILAPAGEAAPIAVSVPLESRTVGSGAGRIAALFGATPTAVPAPPESRTVGGGAGRTAVWFGVIYFGALLAFATAFDVWSVLE